MKHRHFPRSLKDKFGQAVRMQPLMIDSEVRWHHF